MKRIIAIGLDGYEESLGRRFMEAGELPEMARVRERSARYLLDHGPAQRTGLAWEHLSTGLSPEQAGRWAAVHFDPKTYAVWQEGTRLAPFPAGLKSRTVVFDAPYFDLSRAPEVRGIVGWGSHDPGISPAVRPEGLLDEFETRFGTYPAEKWIYGVVWASVEAAREMGEALALAVDRRSQAARWLLSERFTDWDLALVVVSEPHSAIEGLWHGVDPAHPLHQMPSAKPAGEGLLAVYRAVDKLVGELASEFPDATLVVFSMGGMGPNHSDTASMVLLPELMYRHTFGRRLLRGFNGVSDTAVPPMLGAGEDWAGALRGSFPKNRIRGRLENVWRRLIMQRGAHEPTHLRQSVDWIPATVYQPHWRLMQAFALPSFYDGRIRLNVLGREAAGRIAVSEYETCCDEIEALLNECRDPATGDTVVSYIERWKGRDPLTVGPTESDMVVVWKGTFCALDHPALGRIGPVPYRRPGGHTGPFGMAYIMNAELPAGDNRVRSSFDVVPTLIDMLGEPMPPHLSGSSMLK